MNGLTNWDKYIKTSKVGFWIFVDLAVTDKELRICILKAPKEPLGSAVCSDIDVVIIRTYTLLIRLKCVSKKVTIYIVFENNR